MYICSMYIMGLKLESETSSDEDHELCKKLKDEKEMLLKELEQLKAAKLLFSDRQHHHQLIEVEMEEMDDVVTQRLKFDDKNYARGWCV